MDENKVTEIETTEFVGTEDQKEGIQLMDVAIVGGLMASGVAVYKLGGIAYTKAIKPGWNWVRNKLGNKSKDQKAETLPNEEAPKKPEDKKSDTKNQKSK